MSGLNLNYTPTGGQFGSRRRYPGYTIRPREAGGFTVECDKMGAIAGCQTLKRVAAIMRGYRNPYTGEPFTDAEAWPEGVPQ